MKRLRIELDHLPEDGGKQFCDELDSSVFGVDNEEITATGPLSFDLHIQRFEGELFLQGKLSAPFRFKCVRCLDTFLKTIRIDDFATSLEIENQSVVDLTDTLREEIVIDFPAYPNCSDADEKKECKFQPEHFRVDKEGHSGVNTPAPSSNGSVWDALDSLDDQNFTKNQ